ncbi:ferritin-like domain-containing protein [Novispirillum sp. DQ9]|uniref:ferritin-like domain-containing protein n=1 Tax=Novispirillum sp. DQ9 TaxID=3398612 RepID=UPI003C7B865C
MQTIEEFLAHAIRLELEAALRFDELAEACLTNGNAEVAAFFRQMAEFSRLHLADARSRGGFRDLPDLPPSSELWPDGMSPETAGYEGTDPFLHVSRALEIALESEKQGYAFYADIAAATSDPEIRAMAQEFAEEEAEHVAQLEVWIGRHQQSAA